MRLVVNGRKVNVYGAKCTHIASNRDGVFDYTATVRFNTNQALTPYEKQCIQEYIEFLLDERSAVEDKNDG